MEISMYRIGHYLNVRYNVTGAGYGSLEVFFKEEPTEAEIFQLIEKNVTSLIREWNNWEEDKNVVSFDYFELYAENKDISPSSENLENYKIFQKLIDKKSFTFKEIIPYFPKSRLRYLTGAKK